jgi:hypothetical protein
VVDETNEFVPCRSRRQSEERHLDDYDDEADQDRRGQMRELRTQHGDEIPGSAGGGGRNAHLKELPGEHASPCSELSCRDEPAHDRDDDVGS